MRKPNQKLMPGIPCASDVRRVSCSLNSLLERLQPPSAPHRSAPASTPDPDGEAVLARPPAPVLPLLAHAYDWRTDEITAAHAVYLLHNPPFPGGHYRCGTCGQRIPRAMTAQHLDAHFQAKQAHKSADNCRGWYLPVTPTKQQPLKQFTPLPPPPAVVQRDQDTDEAWGCTVCGSPLPAASYDCAQDDWVYKNCARLEDGGLVHAECLI